MRQSKCAARLLAFEKKLFLRRPLMMFIGALLSYLLAITIQVNFLAPPLFP